MADTFQARTNIFISDCRQFVAIRNRNDIPPGECSHFDVVRVDGSETWLSGRYIQVGGGYVLRSARLSRGFYDTNIVDGWSNLGLRKKDGEWIQMFTLHFGNRVTGEFHVATFRTPLRSLAPHYSRSRRG